MVWLDGRMGGWMVWLDGRVDERMDGWRERQLCGCVDV